MTKEHKENEMTVLTDERKPNCDKCLDTGVLWTGPIGDPPEQCGYCFDQSPDQPEVAAQAGQVAVAGWKLVPVEPTEEMIAAAYFGGDLDIAIGHAAAYQRAEIGYAAMLAAAPSPAKESK